MTDKDSIRTEKDFMERRIVKMQFDLISSIIGYILGILSAVVVAIGAVLFAKVWNEWFE